MLNVDQSTPPAEDRRNPRAVWARTRRSGSRTGAAGPAAPPPATATASPLAGARCPAHRGGDQSGSGQVREHLVEERLSVGKRKPLGQAQELFPCGGVESGTKAGLILFGESDSAGVKVGEKLRELCGNGPGVRRGDGRSGSRCRGAHCEGGTEPGQ